MISETGAKTTHFFESQIQAFTIRTMKAEDLEQVFELETKMFPNPWSRESLMYEMLENRNAVALVVERCKGIIGYTLGWCVNREAEIGTFAVDVRYRRSKIGSRLLTSLLEYFHLKGVDTVFLEVRRSNLAAQKLYLSRGFKVSGVRRAYYPDTHEDALLMNLSVGG